jgi:gliding motility-associated-like protein
MLGQNSSAGYSIDLYENVNANYVKKSIALPQLSDASFATADFNSDGILDVVVNGLQGLSTSETYNGPSEFIVLAGGRNLAFTIQNTFISKGSYWGSVSAGDMDQDGLPDIVVNGTGNGSARTTLFKNDHGLNFTEVSAGLIGTLLGDASLGDYDNDGDLDVLVTGSTDGGQSGALARVYRNKEPVVNERPSIPQNLNMAQNGGKATFSWSKSRDTSTPYRSISYNIKIGQVQYGNDQESGMNLEDGTRVIEEIGNAGLDTVFTMALPHGAYYWQVQALDAAYYESLFTPVQPPCSVDAPKADCKPNYCFRDSIIITATGTSLKWYADSLLTQLVNERPDLKMIATVDKQFYITQTVGACTSEPAHLQFTVTKNPVVQYNSHYCYHEPVVLTAEGTAIKWYTDVQLTELVNEGNTYALLAATDSMIYVTQMVGGCTSDATTIRFLVSPRPLLTFFVQNKQIEGDSVTVTRCSESTTVEVEGRSNYPKIVWAGEEGATIKVDKNGIYQVNLSDNHSCTAQGIIVVLFKPMPDGFIPNVITPNGDSLNDRFILSFPQTQALSLIIFNRYGKDVFHSSAYDNEFDGSNLSAGEYYYFIQSSECHRSWKGWLSILK